MDSNYFLSDHYFTNNSSYPNSNYYNYQYYNYYQDQIPQHFNFNILSENSSLSPNNFNSHSSNLSINHDKTEYSSLNNYNLGYSLNESENFSYNDSAYQSQLETSTFHSIYNNQNQQENINFEVNQNPLKRRFDETFFSNDIHESNKRPKIFKIGLDDSKNDNFYCDECGLFFASKAKFLLHQFKAHKNGNSCVCPVCCKLKIVLKKFLFKFYLFIFR